MCSSYAKQELMFHVSQRIITKLDTTDGVRVGNVLTFWSVRPLSLAFLRCL